MQPIKRLIKSLLKKLNLSIIKSSTLSKYEDNSGDMDALLNIPYETLVQLLPLIPLSQSQIKQDLFVLTELGFKKGGYFVEFGATNGKLLSNTHLLEKEFSWNGILAEPARCWHDELSKNRSCNIEKNCVWTHSGLVLNFNEVSAPELSTIQQFNNSDGHSLSREKGLSYDVQTISLLDLLKKHNAPRQIDYLSIDTEGSEFDILNQFDFDAYDIKIITCEHNYTPMRGKIEALLSKKGYSRKYMGISKWDDWYVRN